MIGIELWKVPDTQFGAIPIPAADIFKGPVNSYPNYLTAFKDNLFFSATDELKGNELFMTHNIGFGVTVVKDINTVATSGSNAGIYANALTPLGKNVLFTAFDNSHGTELYKSDGTEGGTTLLNEIFPARQVLILTIL